MSHPDQIDHIEQMARETASRIDDALYGVIPGSERESIIANLVADALRAQRAAAADANALLQRTVNDQARRLVEAQSQIEALTNERDAWTDAANFHLRNEEFYRGLIHQTGKLLGPEVYVSDDGSVQESVLALKVPELVKKLVEGRAEAEARIAVLEADLRTVRAEAVAAETIAQRVEGENFDLVMAAQGSAEGPHGCINCGAANEGGYMTGFEGHTDEGAVGPFCGQCWALVGDFFKKLGRAEGRAALEARIAELEALQSVALVAGAQAFVKAQSDASSAQPRDDRG